MNKIKVKHPIVELNGDEISRTVWQMIKDTLITPYLELDIKYFDLSIENRDLTDDVVTIEAAEAILKYNASTKCPTIIPDEDCVQRLGLKRLFPPVSEVIHTILKGEETKLKLQNSYELSIFFSINSKTILTTSIHEIKDITNANPLAQIFCWTRALSHRATLDKNLELSEFCLKLEELSIQQDKYGTQTLSDFMNKVSEGLKKIYSKEI